MEVGNKNNISELENDSGVQLGRLYICTIPTILSSKSDILFSVHTCKFPAMFHKWKLTRQLYVIATPRSFIDQPTSLLLGTTTPVVDTCHELICFNDEVHNNHRLYLSYFCSKYDFKLMGYNI